MSEKGPLVSVIMPAYNAEKYIGDAIESIRNQTYANWELLIIDDCSTDSTMRVAEGIRDSRIKIWHNKKNKGIACSRNRALSHARGKYVAIMDDDDISFPERFRLQVDFLETHGDIGIVGGRVESIDGEGNTIGRQSGVLNNPLYIKVHFLFKCIFHNSEMMIRKEVIDKNHIYYHENCYGMEDFRFWIECSKVAGMTCLDSFMLKHRYFDGSETSRVKSEEYPQRLSCYRRLQRLSFKLSGFTLSAEDYRIINDSFIEGRLSVADNRQAAALIKVMKKIMDQAVLDEMDFVRELDIYLRKQLELMAVKCEGLWD